MPSLKDLRNSIGSVRNMRKITSAMKMVAVAKLRRAQEHAEAARPQQHVLEIVPLPLHRARRDVRAERPRPDIARS